MAFTLDFSVSFFDEIELRKFAFHHFIDQLLLDRI